MPRRSPPLPRNTGCDFDDIDIVGFHGQTVLHRPEKKLTVQIGDATALAKLIHIPVMYDFRAADVEAGGQGAPFVPVYHRALAQSLDWEGPTVVVNIGGVANITYIDGDTLIACDTGPGNALLDDYMFRWLNQRFDNEGRTAALGKVDAAWINRALQMPFFSLPPPKSLDRNDFERLKLGDIPPEDGAATLTAFTAAAIARVVPLLPKEPKNWIVAGGGARNLTMLRMLRECLAPATVRAADTLGWASDAIEAQAFGFLAARGLKGLPLSYPATTGVPFPMTGGIIADLDGLKTCRCGTRRFDTKYRKRLHASRHGRQLRPNALASGARDGAHTRCCSTTIGGRLTHQCTCI